MDGWPSRVIRRPDARVSSKTGLVPEGKAWVSVRGTSLSRSSSDHTGTSLAPLRISSPRVISALVSARINRVSAVRQPDSRRSLIIGRLSPRCSGPRLSWESAMIGTSSSLASSLIWRENSETSSWRDSTLRPEVISCM